MCRFLLVRSKKKIKPETLLNKFALMCQKSRAPDGDLQGDGWGIASKISNWKIYKSLKPIWEDKEKFHKFPESDLFAVHARSSGFPDQKGIIEYNQPYISDDLCFVFNGMIRGVSLNMELAGKIGAQKILSLLKQKIENDSIEGSLQQINELILSKAKQIEGMNIGVVSKNKFYILCEYEKNSNYFGIRYFQNDGMILICSEPIGDYEWMIMRKGEILSL